jgi:hypothetical protein
MELLVGIAITALLVVFSLSGIQLLQSYKQQYERNNELLWQAGQLKLLLNREATYSAKMQLEEGQLVFYFEQLPDIRYIFEDTFCLRQQGVQTDTFDFPVKLENASFNKQGVSTELISRCQFYLQVFEEKTSFQIEKTYSAQDLLQLNTQ